MFPKGAVAEKPEKKETTVYVVGEKDVQVALTRASRTEVKRAVICACAVVLTTLILVAGTLGAIALLLSFHHDGHFVGLFNGNHGHGHGSDTPSPGDKIDYGGLWPFGGQGNADVTESITDVPRATTGVGDILIDGNDRTHTTAKPKNQNIVTAPPIADSADSSLWESFSAPYSVFSETDPKDSLDYYSESSIGDSTLDPDQGSGSGSVPDQESEDYEEIPYKSSAASFYSSSYPEASYDSVYDPGTGDINQDWDWDGESGSGSGDEEEGSGDNTMRVFQDAFQIDRQRMLKTPQEFTVVRYPVPVSYYRTLCIANSCTIGYMKGQEMIEVIETDLHMKPRKLTVLRKRDGNKLFTMVRDENQGYRAILLEANGLCLLTRLEITQSPDVHHDTATPIIERLSVTLPVELPEPLLNQIGGPIMDTCRGVPVFWAQQVGSSDDTSFIQRIRRSSGSSPPSSDTDRSGEMTLGGGIYFQCCWCADADDPCPCECGHF